MKPKLLSVLSGLTAVAIASSAWGHHGRASYSNDIITLDATVTDFRFVNPHVQVYFDVTNEAGEIEHWQGELTAPNRLARGGWTKTTFQPGDKIQITGYAARNDGKSVAIREILLENGEPIPMYCARNTSASRSSSV